MKVVSSNPLPDYFIPVIVAISVALVSIFVIDHSDLIRSSSGDEIVLYIGRGKISEPEAVAFSAA